MERDHGLLAEGAASFDTTRWGIVMRAEQSQALGSQSALAQLCRNYWYPLYVFARRLRKRYSTLLREEIVRTVSDPAKIDEEIYAVCEDLIASEGRLGQ